MAFSSLGSLGRGKLEANYVQTGAHRMVLFAPDIAWCCIARARCHANGALQSSHSEVCGLWMVHRTFCLNVTQCGREGGDYPQ